MSLAHLFAEAKRQAERTESDRALELSRGARLVVRVDGAIVTLTIMRPKKQLGATELEVFKRDCGIPADASRFPREGQATRDRDGVTWHFIAYRWKEETP